MTNEEMRELTGNVKGNKLSAFFYLLLREKLPVGVVEKMVDEAEEVTEAEFTNGYLGNYAKLLAKRLGEE